MIPFGVEIVEAVSLDQLEQVRTLFQDYQSGLPTQLRFHDSEWQTLPGAYSPPGGTLLLTTVDAQPAGCVGLRPFPLEGACEMKRLYVTPSFRGQNLGRLLIDWIIQAARGLGYTRMRLDTHLPTMGAAVELYRKLGFVEVSAEPMPPVEALTYMELNL
jgi:GNAT superfamily N-acetyltransferase